MNKKSIAFLLLSIIGLTILSNYSSNLIKDPFEEWKTQYGANWGTEEQQYRRLIFEKNVALMKSHNSDSSQTYKMGINQFSAMTDEEFFHTYLDPKPVTNHIVHQMSEPVTNDDIDWTTKDGVTSVKNQGQCGSCWAFSAVGTIESAYKIQKSKTLNLAQQEMVDCTKGSPYNNYGCSGGWPYVALKYVQDKGGISSTASYSYTARDGVCKPAGEKTPIKSYTQLPTTCGDIVKTIYKTPISITVDASNWSRYSSGVFSNCGSSTINHAVLLVGIVDGSYKIKNSWGTSWGQSGFIRLGAAGGNTCGICLYSGVTVQV